MAETSIRCPNCGKKVRVDTICIGEHCWCNNGGLCEECSIKEKEEDNEV